MNNKTEFTSWHVSIAAEAIVAAQFARIGFDVSVQYGANQPEYDLVVCFEEKLLKVSVKGSQDGSWGLCQKYLEKGKADYHRAIDKWCSRHKSNTILCFVQFYSKALGEMPNLYLANPTEVSIRLKETAKGRGDTILYENYTYKTKRAVGYGTTEKIPEIWKFSKDRAMKLLDTM